MVDVIKFIAKIIETRFSNYGISQENEKRKKKLICVYILYIWNLQIKIYIDKINIKLLSRPKFMDRAEFGPCPCTWTCHKKMKYVMTGPNTFKNNKLHI